MLVVLVAMPFIKKVDLFGVKVETNTNAPNIGKDFDINIDDTIDSKEKLIVYDDKVKGIQGEGD